MSATLEWLQFVLAPQMINGLSIGVAVVLMALGLHDHLRPACWT